MIAPKSLRRTVVLAIALTGCVTPAAHARVADQPVGGSARSAPLVQTRPADPGVPPRVDAIGDGASHAPRVAAVPVTQPSSGESPWLWAAIVVAAATSLALLGFALWSMRPGARASTRRDPRAV
jgi:hypothetical protein